MTLLGEWKTQRKKLMGRQKQLCRYRINTAAAGSPSKLMPRCASMCMSEEDTSRERVQGSSKRMRYEIIESLSCRKPADLCVRNRKRTLFLSFFVSKRRQTSQNYTQTQPRNLSSSTVLFQRAVLGENSPDSAVEATTQPLSFDSFISF